MELALDKMSKDLQVEDLVFFLGHREDVWDPTWKADTKDRKNSPEIAETYQEMILAGIKWALKLEEGVSTPGNIP